MKKIYLTILLFGCMQARIGVPSQRFIAKHTAVAFGITEAMGIYLKGSSSLFDGMSNTAILLFGMANAAWMALDCAEKIPEALLKQAVDLMNRTESFKPNNRLSIEKERDRLEAARLLLKKARYDDLASKELVEECTTRLERIEEINNSLDDLLAQRSTGNKYN